MKKSKKSVGQLFICFVFVVAVAFLSPDRPAYADSDSAWCTIVIDDLAVDADTFFKKVMPGDSVKIAVEPFNSVSELEWSVPGGELYGEGNERVFVAPKKSGRYPLTVETRRHGEKLKATIQIYVLVPFSKLVNGKIEGFEIGQYPDPSKRNNSPNYQYPQGFMRVSSAAEAKILITENYAIGEFLPDNYSGWPKFTIVDEKLAAKLEIVTQELRVRGMMKTKFEIFSGYRPPARNRSSGQAEYSRHMYGCAADVVIDDRGKKGWMDDLNGDGSLDLYDSVVLYSLVDEMEEEGLLRGLEGGIGAYPGRKEYGGFVHMDVRGGTEANWILGENGRRVKNLAEFISLHRDEIRIPERQYAYSSRTEHILGGGAAGSTQPRRNAPQSARVASPAKKSPDDFKEQIKELEKEVMTLEEQWRTVRAGPKPLAADDLYVAADVFNESMLLNRGRLILKRIPMKDGESPRACPGGLAKVFCMPEGILEVRGKGVEPVWFHPGWAFLGGDLKLSPKSLRQSFYEKQNASKTIDLGAAVRIYREGILGKVVLPGSICVPEADLFSLNEHTSMGTRVYLFEGGAFVSNATGDAKKRNDLVALQSFLLLRKKTASLNKAHLEIDIEKQRACVKRGDETLKSFGIKIAGPNFSKSYPNAKKQFKLPRGIMMVQHKSTFPEWYKPDWMFEKQNKPVPEPIGSGRIQTRLLGEYALYLGGGIVIHGRHDQLVPDNAIDYVAIELTNDDLRFVWSALPQGAAVILQ